MSAVRITGMSRRIPLVPVLHVLVHCDRELAQVRDALHPIGGPAGTGKHREQKRRQNGDHGNHDEQFYEGKGFPRHHLLPLNLKMRSGRGGISSRPSRWSSVEAVKRRPGSDWVARGQYVQPALVCRHRGPYGPVQRERIVIQVKAIPYQD